MQVLVVGRPLRFESSLGHQFFDVHFLAADSTPSACSAPSGVSSCLKYTNTSPLSASFAILCSSALRSFTEYSSFRSRRYAKSAVCTSGVSSFSLSALHSAAFAARNAPYTSSLNQDSCRNSNATRKDFGSAAKKSFSKATSHFRNGGNWNNTGPNFFSSSNGCRERRKSEVKSATSRSRAMCVIFWCALIANLKFSGVAAIQPRSNYSLGNRRNGK